MKKTFVLLAIALLFSSTLLAQDFNFNEAKEGIKSTISVKLRAIIENFDGEYRGNVTIDSANMISDNEWEIRGRVDYKGSLCDNVTADYKASIYQSGDIEACINTPICSVLGGTMYHEWDCKGSKWSQNDAKLIDYVRKVAETMR